VREGCRHDHGEALLGRPWSGAVERRVQRVILHVDPARAHAVALYRKSGRRSLTADKGIPLLEATPPTGSG